MSDRPEGLRPLPVRIAQRARADIDEAHFWMESRSGAAVADAWEDALYEQMKSVGAVPTGYAVAEDESRRFGMPVRTVSFRRPGSQVAYRVLYTIVADADHRFARLVDPPCVLVMHVRHGARRPLTDAEAREIELAVEYER